VGWAEARDASSGAARPAAKTQNAERRDKTGKLIADLLQNPRVTKRKT
jgi:hypothetical protein